MYLGDYAEDAIIDFKFGTNDAAGASITIATNGTISVYKANGLGKSIAGVTFTEDFDGLIGVHHVRIDLSADVFYATGEDYQVVLSGAVIDGQAVNTVLREFSIEHRHLVDISSLATAAAITALNDLSSAEVNAEVDTALTDIHLDHLLAADYDPAIKPGVATALLNELVEDDGGVSRLTANALEMGPGTTATAVRTEMDANSTQLAAIAADTNEIQTDWVDGGRLDNILDAIGTPPTSGQIVTAIMAHAHEAGKTHSELLVDLWSVLVGNSTANDASAPTQVTYNSPDNTVQITHTLTPTQRSGV